ncbi:MAG: sodium:proton antiporter NhaD, partial [Chitinophagaceae bacterium]
MWLLLLFCIGYFAITLEQFIRLNKVATALIMAALLWTVYGAETGDQGHVLQELRAHLGQISEILFFLLGAMTIVELIDAHDGFEIVTSRINTRSKSKLLWVISGISFFLSAVLDNLTTAIVMVTLVRKIIPDKSFRLFCCGFIILAANSGGAWSPIGDVTTTMLWIGGQISAGPVMQQVFLPSLLSVVIPLIAVSVQLRGSLEGNQLASTPVTPLQTKERRIIFISGLSLLILIPVFKTLTHLPPYIGMLLGLGLIWVITEILHQRRDTEQK